MLEEPCKILMINTNETERMAVRRALEAADFAVEWVEVETCDLAIARLEQQQFDCILLDYGRPNGAGPARFQQLQQAAIAAEQSAPLGVPLVILTEPGEEPMIGKQLPVGVADALAKTNISSESLCRSLRHTLELHQAQQRAALATQQLQASQTRFQTLMQNVSEIMALLDPQGQISYVSPSVERILGYAPGVLQGACIFDFLHPEDLLPAQTRLNQGHLSGNDGTTLVLRLCHANGAWMPLEVGVHLPLPESGIEGRVVTLRQLSKPRQTAARIAQLNPDLEELVAEACLSQDAEEVRENLRQAIAILGEQQRQLHTLQHLTNLLNQRLADLPALLQVMVSVVGEAIPEAQFCLIALQDSQQQQLIPTATAGLQSQKLADADRLYTAAGLLGQVFAQGTARICRADEPEDLPASLCAVAIESNRAGRLGVLAVGNWEDSLAFNPEDCQLLNAFGEQAAIAIDNARLISTLEEREERLARQNLLLARQNRELEHQRQQIQLQNLKLLEATQLKSQFLATMSHELRTPMNAITGFSQLLLRQRQHKLNPQQANMVERILNNGKNLLALINDILDLSKIEAGRMELQLSEFNLCHLLSLTVAELRSLADQKGLHLIVQCPMNEAHIINDKIRLRQILVNLISNAIKFTEQGSIWVMAEPLSPEQVAIAVKDTGIGIAPEDIPLIFEEFWQVDQTTTRKHPGTGLGLAIIQRLVGMMGGKIQVESQLGVGSTFRVEIPRRIEAGWRKSEAAATAVSHRLRSKGEPGPELPAGGHNLL